MLRAIVYTRLIQHPPALARPCPLLPPLCPPATAPGPVPSSPCPLACAAALIHTFPAHTCAMHRSVGRVAVAVSASTPLGFSTDRSTWPSLKMWGSREVCKQLSGAAVNPPGPSMDLRTWPSSEVCMWGRECEIKCGMHRAAATPYPCLCRRGGSCAPPPLPCPSTHPLIPPPCLLT